MQRHHVAEDQPSRIRKCFECNEDFKVAKSLNAHLADKHDPPKPRVRDLFEEMPSGKQKPDKKTALDGNPPSILLDYFQLYLL